jgi:hypothetical protein
VDPGPFFYTVITVYNLLALFIFLQTIIFYHSMRLVLCFQQTGEIDNLTASWVKVSWLCCVQVPRCLLAPHKAPCKVSKQHLRELALTPTGRLNLGFITERKLTAVLFTPYSWGSQLCKASTSFLAPLPGIEEEEAPTSTTRQQDSNSSPVEGASVDARPPSSSAALGGTIGLVVDAGSEPGVV